jgi:hypothetical protein
MLIWKHCDIVVGLEMLLSLVKFGLRTRWRRSTVEGSSHRRTEYVAKVAHERSQAVTEIGLSKKSQSTINDVAPSPRHRSLGVASIVHDCDLAPCRRPTPLQRQRRAKRSVQLQLTAFVHRISERPASRPPSRTRPRQSVCQKGLSPYPHPMSFGQ